MRVPVARAHTLPALLHEVKECLGASGDVVLEVEDALNGEWVTVRTLDQLTGRDSVRMCARHDAAAAAGANTSTAAAARSTVEERDNHRAVIRCEV